MSDIKKIEHEKVVSALKEAENKVKVAQESLDAVHSDLIFLTHLERQLAANVDILKQQDIVVLAPEYKKIRSELGKCRQLLVSKRKDQSNFLESLSKAQAMFKQMKAHFDEVIQRLENNVIYGKFGRKNG